MRQKRREAGFEECLFDAGKRVTGACLSASGAITLNPPPTPNRAACTPATCPWWSTPGERRRQRCVRLLVVAVSEKKKRAFFSTKHNPLPSPPPSTLADAVVVSIYVNPTQFAAHEDFGVYPRTRAADLAALAATGRVAAVFAPKTLYPPPPGTAAAAEPTNDAAVVVGATDTDDGTWVVVDAPPARGLCAASRPHFFRGVATVVTKLFHAADPDVAVFGRKDYQQLAVLTRMASDLLFGVEVVGAPIVRDADGLALSSRNALLTPDARARAPAIRAALLAAVATADEAGEGGVPAEALCSGVSKAIEGSGGTIDYCRAVDASSLAPADTVRGAPGGAAAPTLLAVAAVYGGVRLIDNVVVGRVVGGE